MISVDLRTNFPDVFKALDGVSSSIGDRAVVRALNATATQGKTAMAREIVKTYRISREDAKRRLEITWARHTRGGVEFEVQLTATRKAKGRSMNLIAFVEQSVTLAQGRKRRKDGTIKKLRFQIKRAGGKKTIDGAFIGNRGRTIFRRVGSDRLPIAAVNTIDVTQMFNTKRVAFAVRDLMLKRFQINFDRELHAVMKGFAK